MSVADVPAKAIEGRSPGRIAWMRLKRDKVALAGGFVVLLLILVALFAPLIVSAFGHPRRNCTKTCWTRCWACRPATTAA